MEAYRGKAELRDDLRLDVLLLGCGNSHDKRIQFKGDEQLGPGSPHKEFTDYARLHLHDLDRELAEKYAGDVESFTLHDLNELPYPWQDGAFDEIHAYEVLEHCGRQGDGKFFFDQFNEFWRMLKPGGYFMLSVPMWDAEVAWGVPDHCRVLPPGIFSYLTEDYYADVGRPGFGDYRRFLKGQYWQAIAKHESEEQLHAVLRKVG